MISYVIRARDEEKYLDGCLASIRRTTVPWEAIVVLDRCTDGSAEIARRHAAEEPRVKVFARDVPVSRAGLETLITPRASVHSLPTYVQECFERASFPWKFHMGADFVLSDELLGHLNSGALPTSPTRIRLPCVTPEDGTRNCEEYLSNCLAGFGKWVFWEVPVFLPGAAQVELDLPILNRSSIPDLKPYWNDPPWFVEDRSELAEALLRRYVTAVEIVGPEPRGAARGSNPACDPFYRRVLHAREALAGAGIFFDR